MADQLLVRAVKYLASVCDSARSQDTHGFNAFDAEFGRSLAALQNWTPRQEEAAYKMLSKYRVQLSKCGIELPIRLETQAAPSVQTPVVVSGPIDLSSLAKWSEPKRVNTSRGARDLRTAPVTEAFSTLWKRRKDDMKALGANFGKDLNGEWQLCWWAEVIATPTVQSSGSTRTDELRLDAERNERLRGITPLLLAYQVAAVRQLSFALLSKGALDASDTGTGKTFVSLAASVVLDRPVYVVCPKSVIPSWERAADHFGIELAGICNYELLRRGNEPEAQLIRGEKVDTFVWALPKDTLIIFDECHRMKDYKTLNCALGLAAIRQGYSVLGLSATAADNPKQMKFASLLTGLIQTEKEFWGWMMAHGVEKGRFGFDFNGDVKILHKIHREIFPARGSRLRIADLGNAFPETQISAEAYNINGATAQIQRIYDEMESEIARINASAAKDKGACVLTELLRARQRTEILKVPAIAEMVEDAVESGLSVAVFVNFNETADALCERLKTRCVIRGGQDGQARENNIAAFQADKQRVIIANIRAGGVGVSLHGSPVARMRLSIICPTHSGQDLKQALGRVWRANGARSLQRIFFAAGTVEEKICSQVKTKIARIDTINDGDLMPVGVL